jgi:CHAT domain-containing protein
MTVHEVLRNKVYGFPSALLALALAFAVEGRVGAIPPAKPLTAVQQAQLKERDRYAAEAQKLRQAGQLGEAITAAEKRLAIERDVFGDGHEDVIGALEQLAELHEAREDFAAARKARQEVLTLRTKLHGDKDRLVTNARLALEYLDRLARMDADSRWQLHLREQACDLRRKLLGENHPDYADSLNNLSGLYLAMGEYAKALPLLQQELTIWQDFLDKTFTVMSDRQRLDALDKLKSSLHAYLSVASGTETPAGRLYESVLACKGAVAARHSEERIAREQPNLRPLIDQLRQVRESLAHVAGTKGQRDWPNRFDERESQKEKLEKELNEASAAYRRFRELRHATAAQVAQQLPPRTALIDFLAYTHSTPPPRGKGPLQRKRRLAAFVLVRDRLPACVYLESAEAIERAVQNWRQDVVQSKVPDEAAADLARLIWQPLQPHLAGVRAVLVAPDEPLCALPFAALPGSKPGSYLLEDLAIGYVTSGRQLLELAADTDRPAGRSLLAVGDLIYGHPSAPTPPVALVAGARGSEWKSLPGTQLELRRIDQSFRHAFPRERAPRLLTGKEGTVARLKHELTPSAEVPRWRYLHLATHGFFNVPWPPWKNQAAQADRFDRNPLLRSGLVLAGANQSAAQGILTAEEVNDLDLRSVDLVVLSACETGLGKVAANEGVLGFQRAFQAAGAWTLATSLWSVNDAATSVLMEEFYTNLWQKKLSKLEALRQAQLTVLRNPGRVQQRARELRDLLVPRGVPEELLAARGLGKQAGDLPAGGRIEAGRSPPAWWAAFVLSGDVR